MGKMVSGFPPAQSLNGEPQLVIDQLTELLAGSPSSLVSLGFDGKNPAIDSDGSKGKRNPASEFPPFR